MKFSQFINQNIKLFNLKFLRGPHQIKLKGWLSTPEAWGAFNAWAKIRALPRKSFEPEPVVCIYFNEFFAIDFIKMIFQVLLKILF